MKKIICAVAAFFSFLIIFSLSAGAQGYIFTLKEDIPIPCSESSGISAISAEHGVYAAESYDDFSYLVENSLIDSYEEDGECVLLDTYTPKDKYYDKQYYLQTINAPSAWERGSFGKGVKIAVIDTGISPTASDFSLGTIVPAKDYKSTESSKLNFASDETGHGTLVAGIIAAEHNERGVAGIAPESELYIFKCFDSSGKTSKAIIISAIYSACDEFDCDIISMSIGFTELSEACRQACDHAASKGVLMVAAAGNDGNKEEDGTKLMYPASYDNVISVGSTSKTDHRSVFSQRNDYVNIMAPGEGIYSVSLDGYSSSSGTSFSTPQVTAAAALLMSRYPSLSAEDITQLLYASANEMPDRFSGHGILNIAALFRLADLKSLSSQSAGNLLYEVSGNEVFYSLCAPEDSELFVVNYTDSSLAQVSCSFYGKLSKDLFESAKLFLWKKDSLAPLPPPPKVQTRTD